MTFLERLKLETHDLHTALESVLPLGRSHLGLGEYREVLLTFAAVILPLEHRLRALNLPGEFELSSRLRGANLEADLAALGVTHLPCPTDWDSLTVREAPGALYVLEGSRLGGAIISRGLLRLGLSPERGAAYFAPPADLAQHWRKFQTLLESQVTEAAQADTIRGARRVFETLLAVWSRVHAARMVGA